MIQEDRCPQTGKVAHRHYAAAQEALRKHRYAARRQGNTENGNIHIFRCEHCSKFHLGNTDGEQLATVRRERANRIRNRDDEGCDDYA